MAFLNIAIFYEMLDITAVLPYLGIIITIISAVIYIARWTAVSDEKLRNLIKDTNSLSEKIRNLLEKQNEIINKINTDYVAIFERIKQMYKTIDESQTYLIRMIRDNHESIQTQLDDLKKRMERVENILINSKK